MTANDIDFRCSSLGHIMPGPREKEGKIAEGVLTHLIDVFVSAKYKRREEPQSKILSKGNEREEDSITLLSRVTKTFYTKNDVRLSNGFITGEPDLFRGESISNADETNDTKTSWSAYTYFRTQYKSLDEKYYWQGMGYMWLTGAKKHTVSFCLVNGTVAAIMDEKRKLGYQMNVFGTEIVNPAYVEKCKQIEINHIFDMEAFRRENPGFDFDNDLAEWKYDIPMNERLYQFSFERNDTEIEQIKQRVIQCRKWMDTHLFKTELNKQLESA